MMKRTPEISPVVDDAVVNGVLFDLSDHDDKWKNLGSQRAALARGAVIKAELLRREGIDPGDAYLQGIADAQAVQGRAVQIAQMMPLFDIDKFRLDLDDVS